MPPDPAASPGYFDTPARAERLQLLAHLLRNVGEVLYLRGPAGAGKTLFAHTLLHELGDEMVTVWLNAGQHADLGAAITEGLELKPAAGAWPDNLMAALAGRQLLVVVDDADELPADALERLAALHTGGGRLLLVGQGGLAQIGADWDVQFVDLPPFNAAQSKAFLRSRAGENAERVTDETAAALHRAAQGMPGPLLDGLEEVVSGRPRAPATPAAQPAPGRRLPGGAGRWLVGGLVVAALAAILLNQDRINRIFEPSAEQAGAQPAPPPPQTRRQAADDGVAPSREVEAPALPLAEPEVAGGAVDLAQPGPLPPAPATDAALPPAAAGDSAAVTAAAEESDPPLPGPAPADDPNGAPAAARAAASPDEDPLEAVLRDALAAAADLSSEAAAGETGAMAVDPSGPEGIGSAPAAQASAAPARAAEPAREATSTDDDAGEVTQRAALPTAGDEAPARPAAGPAPVVDRATVAPTAPEPPAAVKATALPPAAAPGPAPAPVEDRSTAAQAATPARPADKPAVEPAAAPAAAPVVSRQAARTGLDWLKSRQPARYTLQLIGGRDRAAIERYVREQAIAPPYAIFERQLDGRPWYSLVAGDYPDRAAAVAALSGLPAALGRADVWPRSFESIQKLL